MLKEAFFIFLRLDSQRAAAEQPDQARFDVMLAATGIIMGKDTIYRTAKTPVPPFEFDAAVADVFDDMIHYTMVKTTTFNGVKHPNICILQENGTLEIVKQFTHQDFKTRLS